MLDKMWDHFFKAEKGLSSAIENLEEVEQSLDELGFDEAAEEIYNVIGILQQINGVEPTVRNVCIQDIIDVVGDEVYEIQNKR